MKKILIRAGFAIASLIIMLMAGILIIIVHVAKFLMRRAISSSSKDLFHDSRKHPLNDQEAPLG